MGSKPSTGRRESKPENEKFSVQPQLKPTKTVGSGDTFSPHEVPEMSDKHDIKREESVSNRELMISYSHKDKEMMAKLREGLEKNGISVWVDVVGLGAGVDFLSKIGQAILDAKLTETKPRHQHQRRHQDLVKVFGAGPISNLLLVLPSSNLHGWCIWT